MLEIPSAEVRAYSSSHFYAFGAMMIVPIRRL